MAEPAAPRELVSIKITRDAYVALNEIVLEDIRQGASAPEKTQIASDAITEKRDRRLGKLKAGQLSKSK